MNAPATPPTMVRHGRVELALHSLREGEGTPLLLLHELGGRAPASLPRWLSRWRGAVHALDFTGHGRSGWPVGGGYTVEALVGDADAALSALTSAALVGWGLGGYVATLLAGARPSAVRGVLVLAGAGLAGGGTEPSGLGSTLPAPHDEPPGEPAGVDPWALLELSRDIRPPEYALVFARAAVDGGVPLRCAPSLLASAPPWLRALAENDLLAAASPADALVHLGG